jgi:lipopolysaccharide/colanic/teichoic acid biosynthesis glycosyltransferase
MGLIYSIINRLLALILLISTSPIALLIAVVIRIDSPGEIIFKQTRVGFYGKKFTFYKFRTMVANAKKIFPKYYIYIFSKKEIQNFRFKTDKDPRLTKIGRIVRKTSLDEIPNLINVIKGDMNLVGPRPEIPEMLPYYSAKEKIKFTVKPGITGYAQVSGRGDLTFKQTLAYDLRYVREKSIKTDAKILYKTLLVIIKASGAY